MEVHIVRKGDTLWKISRHYGISFDELKRVNAHLANPDYIVPGMKIFLPAKSAEKGKEVEKKPSKGEAVKKTEKEPIKVVPAPVEEIKVPSQPKPIPEKPKAPVVPEKPKSTEAPAIPTMPKVPQMQPMQPMQPMHQQMPFVGVPCGWMPIFDVDCFPFVQPGHMHQPMPAPQLPVEPESPMHIKEKSMPKPMPMPMPLPTEKTMPDGWKLLESPDLQFEEDIKFKKLPEVHFEESPILKVEEIKAKTEELPTPSPPRYQMPIAQEVPMQSEWQYAQPGGYAAYPQAGCGCGPGQAQPYHQMNHCSACGQYHPTPPPVQQHINHCNACNQPIQAMPGQMMPYPSQHHNWPGTY